MSEELSVLNAHLDALEQKVGRLHDLSVSTSVSHKLIKLKALTICQNKPARSARRHAVARSMVSANHLFRSIESYTFQLPVNAG